jgi:hypothetical protein
MRAVLAAALVVVGCGSVDHTPPAPPPDAKILGLPDPDGAIDSGSALDAEESDAPAVGDARPDAAPDAAPDGPPAQAVFISEVMYHPVLEDDYEDQHEFVELHNRSEAEVDLGGWRLAGDVTFTFPAGATIPARGFTVVTKNRTALAAVPSYGLKVESLQGNYAGQLDNGKGELSIANAQGEVVEVVRYADRFPWPVAADGLGAGESSLPSHFLPIAQHRYRGVSLERVSYELPASVIANWVPSPLDGASPGRANSLGGTPPTIVETLQVAPSGRRGLIHANDEVMLSATFSAQGPLADIQVEYFVDNLERTDEPRAKVAMSRAAGEARLPAQPETSIVRYRIVGDRGQGPEVISPRPSDPFGWHAYYVSPPINAPQPPYQLFIKSTDWGQLWTNIDFGDQNDRRVIPELIGDQLVRCRIRESWDARVPAVFVYEGVVYDVRVRYQGSRFQRRNGRAIDLTRTSFKPPPVPMMGNDPAVPYLEALSWNVNFPRYKRFADGRDSIILNKLNQSCPGLDASIGEQLYAAAGLPSSRTQYHRLYVNGGYYAYVMDLENPSENLLARYTPRGTRVGDLFKASGNDGSSEEGPWGRADEQPLPTSCVGRTTSYDPLTRYAYTYERKTWDWKDATDIKLLIEGLEAARVASHLDDDDAANDDIAPLRAFLGKTFDIDKTLTYLAIRNWAEPWDDYFHNHFLYKDAQGRWSYIPWDLDREFGEEYSWNTHRSFFLGEKGDRDSRRGHWNRLKDAFMRAYRGELLARLEKLSAEPLATDPQRGVLTAARWRSMVESAAARFEPAEAMASPVQNICDFAKEKANLLKFAEERNVELADVLSCASRSCGLTAEYFNGASFDPANRVFTRTDRAIGFRWGSTRPTPTFPSDLWQVRWTGRINPPGPGFYTFHTSTEGGVRLWVGGFLVIDNWNDLPLHEDSSVTVPLFLATSFDVRLEYIGGGSGAGITLSWSGPGITKQFLGGRYLTPAP